MTALTAAACSDLCSAKTAFVNELIVGVRVCTLFVLRRKELRISARSGAYALYTLADRSGGTRAIQFEVDAAQLPPEGSVVVVAGQMEGRGRSRRFKVSSLAAAQSWNPADFIERVARPSDEMQAEFREWLRQVGDGQLRAVVSAVYGSGETWECFAQAPLASSGFGARLGAALEHSLRLARCVDALAENHPSLDRDLLLSAALLRFTGCVDAFTLGAQIEETPAGSGLGAQLLGLYRLHEAARKTKLRGETTLRLEQAIVGKKESDLAEAALLELCLETENAAAAFEEHDRYRRLACDLITTRAA